MGDGSRVVNIYELNSEKYRVFVYFSYRDVTTCFTEHKKINAISKFKLSLENWVRYS